MAIIMRGVSRCAICRALLREDDAIFATSGCFLAEDDPLARYCDAAMHWSCYEAWPERPRFAREAHASKVENETEAEFWDRVYADDAVLITANVDEDVASTWVHLAEVGNQIGVDFEDWVAFVTTGETRQELYALERDLLARARPAIAAALPSVEALRTAADQRRASKAP